jgi:hypothetical protein
VNARDQRQALQRHLSHAREALDGGDRSLALEQVEAALAIDAGYLAAQTLRERILEPTPAVIPDRFPSESREPATASVESQPAPPGDPPLVSREGMARFEARARQRRVDRRITAARAAIARRRFADATVALDEVRELDPGHPDVVALAFELDAAEHTRRGRVGPWLMAAAAFGGITLGATWLESPDGLIGFPMLDLGVLVPNLPPAESGFTPAPAPDLTADAARDDRQGLVPSRVAPAAPAVTPAVVVARTPDPAPALAPAAAVASPPVASPPVASPPVASASDAVPAVRDVATAVRDVAMAPVAPAVPVSPPPVASPPPIVAAPIIPPAPLDEERVRLTLQRYRSAYEGLDARLASAVWPTVNQSALERAFQGLESQRLTFDACAVQLRGGAATAVCRGTTRYVPKVGSREPHVEPRVWNFTLRKSGDDWTIENARAER